MEYSETINETKNGVRSNACCVSAPPPKCCLGLVVTTIEPLKVCLDDDSSIEDGDEDMFDDDAFTFCDEDFQALMSHEAMQRIIPSHSRCRGTPASAVVAAPNSYPPLHSGASLIPEKAASIADSSTQGVDLPPSTAASSIVSLGTLTLASSTSSNSVSKKTRTKRRVSLHKNVAIMPIPMRTEYSPLIRKGLWNSASELYQNAVRNTIEFAAEGFEWRNAVDDSRMIELPHGERVHPIHYMNISNSGCNALTNGRDSRSRQAEVIDPSYCP